MPVPEAPTMPTGPRCDAVREAEADAGEDRRAAVGAHHEQPERRGPRA